MRQAKLINKQVVPWPIETDKQAIEWSDWFEDANRCVGADEIGDIMISTTFLGISNEVYGPDKWFETMILNGEHEGYTERYTTWAEAEAGHARAIARVKNLPPPETN